MNIRNFCIIAHIDHGKSTLADRFLELTGTVEKRDMKEQMLDQMDLERERGITIKLAPVRMKYNPTQPPLKLRGGEEGLYILNLIDTPGHVDFTYEVSRSLAAVEGAVLLVDATQGVQAQTIGNLYLALEQNLTIIPVINKIDLPNAQIEKTKSEIVHLIGCDEKEILCVSGKTGAGVEDLLKAVIERIPPPKSLEGESLRALIFDSIYDKYRGVVAYVRVFGGSIKKDTPIQFMASKAKSSALEVGYFTPKLKSSDEIQSGEIGYIVTGLKDISGCRVGDTITDVKCQMSNVKCVPLPGYKEVVPMVFAGLFPKEGNEYTQLREAIEKIKLNDAALVFEPERSTALGFGFRCGFLGLLHLEIVEERLKREHNLAIVITVPSVAYNVTKTDDSLVTIKGAQELPDQNYIQKVEEPWMRVDVVVPKVYIGGLMQFIQEKRGIYKNMEYLSQTDERVILHYELPLSSILTDFYDRLKSISSGYASLNYEFFEYRETDVVRMDVLVADEPVEALATIVYRDSAFESGKKIVQALKNTLPRQQFVLKIQAAIGGKIIAAERIAAYRKDVTAKLYGGDATRKMKLLEKQKKGKKKMLARGAGKVDIPSEAYLAVLKR